MGSALVALLAALCALIASAIAYDTVDYAFDAGPAIAAMVHLDVHGFFASEPQMGSFSLLLRWPFAALAGSGRGALLPQYRFGVFACLFVSAMAGLLLARQMRYRGRGDAAIAITLLLWLLNPAARQAINIGHPEEILGGALCVVALLAATCDRPRASGASLGLALATKQWALAAVPATLIGSWRDRFKVGAVAAAVWLPLEVPLVIGNFAAYERVGRFGVTVGAPSGVWWPLTGVLSASVIDAVARPLVLVAALVVSILAWRRDGARGPERALGVLALVLLLRALLDPTGNEYFAVPFLMALLAFEGLTGSGLPIVSIVSATMLAITFDWLRLSSTSTITNLVYLAWALPVAGYLWLRVRSGPRLKRSARPPIYQACT